MGAQLGAKGLGPAGNLRRRVVDKALGRLQAPLARAVAIAAAGGEELSPMDDVSGALAGAGPAGAAVAAPLAEEADFSVWNIVSLAMLAGFMGICGLLAMDVIRNIWTWNEPFGITGALMNMLTGM